MIIAWGPSEAGRIWVGRADMEFRVREPPPPPRHLLVWVERCGLTVEFCWIAPLGATFAELERQLREDAGAVELALEDEWLAEERRRAANRRMALNWRGVP